MNAKHDRNQEIVRRHEAGETLAEIAPLYGVSRERVRQIVRRAGVPRQITEANRNRRIAAAWAAKRVKSVCRRCGRTTMDPPHRRHQYCSHLCRYAAQRHSDADLISAMRRMAARLGHTPRQRDLAEYAHTTYIRRWGSTRAAQIAAGLEPNIQNKVAPLPEGFEP